MNSVFDFLKRLGPQKLMAMGAVTLALMGFFAFIIMRVTAPTMTTLFSDLNMQDSTAVMRDLEQRGVKYEMRYDGSTILVAKDQTLRLRMELASKGLPQGGGIGYEIFDKTDSLSATSFVQNINQLRALEGELARTIRALDRVQNARVHLALPEKQLFTREKKEARASIVLKVRGELDPGQVRAIRHLTASAVEGLKPERVSIVDEAGRLLADGAGDTNDHTGAIAEKQLGYERRVRTQIEDIVASVVGRGRTRVQVAAEMDFNRVQQTQESFDPESRVVRSTQTRNENNLSNDAREGQVTVNNELPGSGAQGQNNTAREASQKNEETVNYEISKTVRTEVLEGGRIKKLSVAVLVDGNYVRGTNGQTNYEARPQEEIDRINTLVRSAMGFDQRRGDTLEVVNLRFAEAPPVNEIKELTTFEKLFNFSKDDTFRMLELGILAIVSAFVFLFVVRPMMAMIAAPEKNTKTVMVKGNNGQMVAVTAPADAAGALSGPVLNEPPTATEQMIEMSQISGAIQARSVEKVGEVASKAPQESVAILRQWIHGSN
ncbi:MAG: flagellar basal-body MS-ring/collar protein FliF [Beijerinckiaceae bacterium]